MCTYTVDSYLARAGYTQVEHLLFLEINLVPNHNYLFIHLFKCIYNYNEYIVIIVTHVMYFFYLLLL